MTLSRLFIESLLREELERAQRQVVPRLGHGSISRRGFVWLQFGRTVRNENARR